MAEKDEFDLDVEFDASHLVVDEDDEIGQQSYKELTLPHPSLSEVVTSGSANEGDGPNEERGRKDLDALDYQKQQVDSFGNDMDDDEMDMILSQIDEEEIVRSSQNVVAVGKHKSSANNEVPTPEPFSEHSITKPAPDESTSNDESHSKSFDRSEVKKQLQQAKSPGKRTLIDSDTCSFFLSQSQPANHVVCPAKPSFPGPAGLLPNLTKNQDGSLCPPTKKSRRDPVLCLISNSPKRKTKSNDVDDKHLVGLTKAPWKLILRHLNLNLNDADCLLHLLNIEGLRKAKSKGKGIKLKVPEGGKVPFLAVVVRDEPLDYQNKMDLDQVMLTLMDPTGFITAVLSPSFIKAFGKLISPGTAIVLRNCIVRTFSDQTHVVITKKCVMCLATNKVESDDEDDEDENENGNFAATPPCPDNRDSNEFPLCLSEDGVILQQFFPFSTETILGEYSNLMNSLKNAKREKDKTVKKVPHNYNAAPGSNELFTVVASNATTTSYPNEGFGDNTEFDDEDDALFIQALQNYEFQIEEDIL